MRIVAALGLFVAIATAVCPLQICFERDGGHAAPAAPGKHGHDDHKGPDRDSGCCTDVPRETGGPWAVAHLDLPSVRWAAPVMGPRTPPASTPACAPVVVPARSTVLLR